MTVFFFCLVEASSVLFGSRAWFQMKVSVRNTSLETSPQSHATKTFPSWVFIAQPCPCTCNDAFETVWGHFESPSRDTRNKICQGKSLWIQDAESPIISVDLDSPWGHISRTMGIRGHTSRIYCKLYIQPRNSSYASAPVIPSATKLTLYIFLDLWGPRIANHNFTFMVSITYEFAFSYRSFSWFPTSSCRAIWDSQIILLPLISLPDLVLLLF